jgi:hypothetical protein
MKIINTVLCVECDSLLPDTVFTCPYCFNTVLWPLRKFIAPKTDAEYIHEKAHKRNAAGNSATDS